MSIIPDKKSGRNSVPIPLKNFSLLELLLKLEHCKRIQPVFEKVRQEPEFLGCNIITWQTEEQIFDSVQGIPLRGFLPTLQYWTTTRKVHPAVWNGYV